MSNFAEGLIQLIVLLVVCLLFLRWFAGVGIGAPFLPARRRDVDDAMALAQVTSADAIIDLGSGDGRFLVAAATQGARVIGYELNPFLVWFTKYAVRPFGERAQVYRRNMFEADLSGVTKVFVFQMGHVMPRLAEKLSKEAPQARIFTVAFDIPGYETVAQRGVVKEVKKIA